MDRPKRSPTKRPLKRRKPNMTRIRTSRSYTVSEVADCLNRSVRTVRYWIRQGLPVLPRTSPRLIDGAVLRSWLKDKWDKNKRPCEFGELYCCKCRAARTPKPKSLKTEPGFDRSTVLISGDCSLCGTAMRLSRKVDDLPKILSAMKLTTQAEPDLTGYRSPAAKLTFWHHPSEEQHNYDEEGKDSVH